MIVSARQLATWVCLSGLLTVILLLIGFEPVGQLFALVQMVGLVGAPLAVLLNQDLRSRGVAAAVSVAVSLALSALAVQSLSWFDLLTPELAVLVSTAFGFVLVWLLSSTAVGRGRGLETTERNPQP